MLAFCPLHVGLSRDGLIYLYSPGSYFSGQFFFFFFFACLFGLILPLLCLFQYTDEEVERCYEEFYEDVHTEFLKFGEIVNFKVA